MFSACTARCALSSPGTDRSRETRAGEPGAQDQSPPNRSIRASVLSRQSPEIMGLSVDLLPQLLIPLLIIGGIVYMFTQRNRVRTRNAPLRAEIEAQVSYETALERASILGTGGFGGTRGYWISLRGPKRLIVGTDAFMVCAPQAFREFVFTGRESF